MTKRFCIAIVAVLVILFLVSYLPVHGEEAVYDTVVRLHVLANSDSEEDQALKLRVRDAVLAVTTPLVEGCKTQADAIAAIEGGMEDIQAAAEQVIADAGRTDEVGVLLGEEEYPTRTYDSCCFPAGEYVSLRVCIGEAEGQNWWCVLFPPLCLSAASATAGDAESNEEAFISVGLNRDQYGIITETENTKYKIRFKLLETVEGWIR